MPGAAATALLRTMIRIHPTRRCCSPRFLRCSCAEECERVRSKGKDRTMTIEGMNHFTVLTDDVAKTVRFYGELLGLVPGERPNFDFPGAWLCAEGRAILHIVGGRSRDALQPGAVDPIRFSPRRLA